MGVWLEEGRLSVYNGDLTGRVFGINADKWSREELAEVIAAGEYLLNISFSENFKSQLLDNCLDSVFIVQESCYQACLLENIKRTQKTYLENIGADIDVGDLIKEVVNQQTGRYHSFITQVALGFQDTALRMYAWLLYVVLSTETAHLEKGIRLNEIRECLEKHHPNKADLNPGNVTQALQSLASLQVKKDITPIVLDYDQTNLLLSVVDRGFLIWIKNQNSKDLLSLAGFNKT